jgi:cation-transporting ATPase I
VDETCLTGESLPVWKGAAPSFAPHVADRTSMLYEGTAIAAGDVDAVVVAVGADTEARSGERMDALAPESGVEQRLRSLTALTTPIAVAGGLGIGALGAMRGVPVRDVVGSGVALTVAAVPEGLPLLATVAQVGAARRLSARGALPRTHRAIEALGRVNVACVDKTGTLTEGRIALAVVSDGVREEPLDRLSAWARELVAAGVRASPESGNGDVPHPTDRALLEGANGLGVIGDGWAVDWQRVAELPFEPSRGYHAVLGAGNGEARLTVKGAPEVVIARCSYVRREGVDVRLSAADRLELRKGVERLAHQGLRVLAVAERTVPAESILDEEAIEGLVLLGCLGFSDPVRPAAAAAVAGLRSAGVDVVMITGDHPSTAEGIGVELGLVDGRRVMTGHELDELAEDDLIAVLPEVGVFARVTPAHKVRIVCALQSAGKVVAMTGDGANDAPAIRLADVGIAFGERSTAAARDAADLVVLDDRIETIVDALLEGRALWASVREAVAILVGGNLGEMAFTIAGTVLAGRSPLNARQLLLVNLLTDVAPAMAVAVRQPSRPSPEDLIREGPEASLGASLNRALAVRAIATAAGATGAWFAARATGTPRHADTVGLVALVGAQLGQTVLVGGGDPVVLLTGLGSAALLATIVQLPGLSHVFGCRPLGPVGWTIASASAALATAGAAFGPKILTPSRVMRSEQRRPPIGNGPAQVLELRPGLSRPGAPVRMVPQPVG